MLGIAALLLVQFAWVRPTNFGGFDEWVILSLVDRGIVDIPYANRPYELLPSLPARGLPVSLWSYYALHTLYLAGQACLVFWLCRRLLPQQPSVALLAGCFAASWAPLDYHRLNVVMPYAGHACAAYLAIVLLVESWLRGRPALLALGALLAFVSIRGYEAGAALLLGAPMLFLFLREPSRRALRWILAWEAAVLLALALAALPILLPAGQFAYQRQLMGGLDLHPLAVLGRLAEQYRFHLLPLVTTAPSELLAPIVPAALAVFATVFLLHARGAEPSPSAAAVSQRRELGVLSAAGLLLAGLGYAVLVLSRLLVQAARTQFFSALGIALFLACACGWLASFAAPRRRLAALGLLGAWVVAVGAGRTLALQGFWDRVSLHPYQDRLLSWLTQRAPRFKPNTFVVLIDAGATFETTFSFRHALAYLYPGEAVGYAWGKVDLFYPARFTPEGILSEPWPELREAWRAPVSFHRYDEVVVVEQTRAGVLRLLEQWPGELLPPLPAAAAYAPRDRIVRGEPPRQRRILRGAAR